MPAPKTRYAKCGDLSIAYHTGECEVAGRDVSGLAVNVASRVQSAADPGEILVSGTVRELGGGSVLEFADRGARALKGFDGEWHLYALSD